MARKKNVPRCPECDEPKEIVFAGTVVRYPTFSCPTHGPDKRNEWELWFEKYRDDWRDEGAWEGEANRRLSCLVGYICNKYWEFYGTPYVFAYGSPNPWTDQDFMLVRRLLAMFWQNAREARTYVRWVFAKRIRSPKYTISSMGFFASSKFVNEYFQAKAKSEKLTRSTKLPADFTAWCLQNHPEIFELQQFETWNDLNGLVTHVRSHGTDSVEGRVVCEAINRGMLPDGGYAKLEG